MTKKEFAIWAMGLKTFYPRDNFLDSEQAIELWFQQLQDIPYEVAKCVLQKWVATNKWIPTIAEIRELAAEIINGEIPDWGKAWEEVCYAISYFGIYRPNEALASLSPLTRETAKKIGFVNLCRSENPTADRANFRILYEKIIVRKKQNSQIPEQLQKMIEEIQKKRLGGGSL